MSDAPLPLAALVSQVLVAYTIEFDNEFELRAPHATTRYRAGPPAGPWLTSRAMWSNCMRFLRDGPVAADALVRRAGTHTNLDGMVRWGHVTVRDGIVAPTRRGRHAIAVWNELDGVIEPRWRERFGNENIEALEAACDRLDQTLTPGLPDCMPILHYAMLSAPGVGALGEPREDVDRSLPAMLSRIALTFGLAYERETKASLAMAANVLRLLAEPVAVRALPRAGGISKEAIAGAIGFLQRHGFAAVGPERPGSSFKAVTLTASGHAARKAYETVRTIEARMRERTPELTDGLRVALERIAGPNGDDPRLLAGLAPKPENWRAKVAPIEHLPHFPVVLHRGGYPDGS